MAALIAVPYLKLNLIDKGIINYMFELVINCIRASRASRSHYHAKCGNLLHRQVIRVCFCSVGKHCVRRSTHTVCWQTWLHKRAHIIFIALLSWHWAIVCSAQCGSRCRFFLFLFGSKYGKKTFFVEGSITKCRERLSDTTSNMCRCLFIRDFQK